MLKKKTKAPERALFRFGRIWILLRIRYAGLCPLKSSVKGVRTFGSFIPTHNTKEKHPETSVFILAGVAGFEPQK